MGGTLCGHRLPVSRKPQDSPRPSPCLSRGWCRGVLLPSAAGSGTDSGARAGAGGRLAVSKRFGREGEFVARGIAAGGGADKPEVWFGAGGAAGAAGGAWPEAVAALVAAGGEDDAEAAEKLLRFY